MATLPNFPAIRPSLLLDFANSGRVDPRLNFTRATTAMRWGPGGALEVVPAGVPRIDYDPLTGQCLGLLLEEQRANLLLNSAIPAAQSVAVTAQVYTLSIYGAGSVAITGAHTGTLNGSGASNNRTTLTFTPSAGSITLTPSGSGVNWQLEAGSFATSFIPTGNAAVTRTVETATINDIAAWFNPAEGAMVLGFRHVNGSASDSTLLCLDNGGSDQAEQHVIRTSGSGTTVRYTPRAQGANIVDLGFLGGVALGSNVNAAISYGGGSFAGAGNGGAPVSLAAPLLPTGLTRLRFGQRGADSSGRMTGHLRYFAYWPKKPTNEQLQRLTA